MPSSGRVLHGARFCDAGGATPGVASPGSVIERLDELRGQRERVQSSGARRSRLSPPDRRRGHGLSKPSPKRESERPLNVTNIVGARRRRVRVAERIPAQTSANTLAVTVPFAVMPLTATSNSLGPPLTSAVVAPAVPPSVTSPVANEPTGSENTTLNA